MLPSNLLYNALLAVVCGAMLFHLSRNRTGLSFVALGVLFAASAMLIAAVVGLGVERSSFASMRLLCFGVFVHAPIYAAAGCWMLRRTSRGGAVLAGLSAAALVAIGIDAFFVEPHWLEVTKYEIRSDKVAKPLRIVVLADIQTDDVGEYERDVLRRAVEAEPDLILFPGDYLQVESAAEWDEQRDKLRELLREAKLDAPLGAYAVEGNIDYAKWPRIFDGTGIVATAPTRAFDLAEGTIRLTCLSEPDSGAVDGADGLSSPDGAFRICVGHRPDFALGEPTADLLIAGHTHGGQVQLPIVGPLITLARIRRSWAAGLNEIHAGQYLFVSRGIGMERADAPRLRFLCRPELAIIDVLPR